MANELPKTLTIEQAFGVTIELFKQCQAERDKYRKALEWMNEHICSGDEYRRFVRDTLIKAGTHEDANG